MKYQEKISYLQNVIYKTILSSQKYKLYDILGANELNLCISTLDTIYKDLSLLNNADENNIKNKIASIISELLVVFKNFGTESFIDLITLLISEDYIIEYFHNKTQIYDKFKIIESCVHPINFKSMNWKTDTNTDSNKKILQKNRIIEDLLILENAENLECFDLSRTSKSFQTKVYGIKVAIHDYKNKKTYIIACIVDDILLSCYNSAFLKNKIEILNLEKPYDKEFNIEYWNRYVSSLTLKELLVYNNSELYSKFQGIINQLYLIKQKTISQVVKEFINADLFIQRTTLIQLLIKSNENEFQYLAYLLYDLLSNENNGSIDTLDQTLLYDSLPWNIKKYFKHAMKQTIQYTNDLYNFDNNKIPLEQQICLIKANDTVKEKAILKLKEIKAKSEDSGTKARQYLDGLLKIPFGIVKEEHILTIINNIQELFKNILNKINNNTLYSNNISIDIKDKYINIELLNHINDIENIYINKIINDSINNLISKINSLKKENIINIHNHINCLIKSNNLTYKKLIYSGKTIIVLKKNINDFIKHFFNNHTIINSIYTNFSSILSSNNHIEYITSLVNDIELIRNNINEVTEYISSVNNTLNKSVYGHSNAKRQIERIIGQWINGEKSGYCFGFEGPPGVGKCFKKNTPIMLYNGEIKMAQNITIQDKLMGDDSTPRNVISLGSGIEKMYKIEQIKGDDYIVNESHILSLKMTKSGKKNKHQTILGRRYYKNDIVDICINDYLSLPKYLQESLKGYKVGIDFIEKGVDLDPYALGYWLGDGTASCFQITTIDKEVVDYFKEYVLKNGLQLIQGKTEKSKITYNISTGFTGGRSDKNKLLNYLKNYDLIKNKHIPELYKLNSRNNRLKLLAGLIDSDGYYCKTNNSLEITQKNKRLSDDILFLVRSLGFCGTMKKCTKSCMYKNERKYGQYYRIIISGHGREEIPTLLERKRAKPHKQIKNGLNTGIKIIPLDEDKYYGFQIDGNSRFLLGDFTVTHNTTIAKKGIAQCLKDQDGEVRPFAFIAVGGSANGSTLEGHNYTYVGSTWGRIVDILIETKCMNPIIFIDELDKISKTEHGKEIIGILTHLIDSTQNDSFQDKYFSGIDLDLSKALFIFSYNDVECIDRILLDRIHRIKFKHLSLEEKLVITNKYILPEIYKKMGFNNIIYMSNNIIEYIINTYTNEPGVRKLKEILFEIIGEINLLLLIPNNENIAFPINITIDDIKYKYLKNRPEHKIKKINCLHSIGVINGLWANSVGQGGLLPIESRFYPSSNFLDLKLTGMQGDVMKESMNVAKTLAWSLLDIKSQKQYQTKFEKIKNFGIHIHVPEGATPKDGPSGGAGITTVIYSLLSQKKINKDFAITGEICLQGKVTAIGGLDLKILGGIKSGATKFIYPKDNDKDYKEFYENLTDKTILNNIELFPVETIQEVFKLIFINEKTD
jgi:ATP-dependent Lon protease